MIPIILIYLLRFCGAQSPEVNYIVNMDSQLKCCDEESKAFADTSGVTVGRYNETVAYMHGVMKLLKDVGPDTMVELILQKEVSGKYVIIFMHEICDMCAEVALGPESNYYMFMKYIGIPKQCPFVAGDYPVDDLIVDTDVIPLNSNTAGRYQASMTLYKNPEKDCMTNKEFMYCVTLQLLVEMN